jgi:hypothetical protein
MSKINNLAIPRTNNLFGGAGIIYGEDIYGEDIVFTLFCWYYPVKQKGCDY